MSETPLKQVIDASIENIRKVVDADTVIGTPITVGETTIIPISKISCGFTSGGLDYDSKVTKGLQHFGGGNGAGVSVTPVSFIVISNGEVRLMNLNGTNTSAENSVVGAVCDLVDKTPSIVKKIKDLFPKKSEEKAESEIKTEE